MLKRRYYCEICRDEKSVNEVFGIWFGSSGRTFTISRATETDGTHICRKCLVHLVKLVRLECPFCGTQDGSHSADCAMLE